MLVKGFVTAGSRETSLYDVTFLVVMVTAAVDVADEVLVVCVLTFFLTPSFVGPLLFDTASFDNDVIAGLGAALGLDGASGRSLPAVKRARNPLDSPFASDANTTRT